MALLVSASSSARSAWTRSAASRACSTSGHPVAAEPTDRTLVNGAVPLFLAGLAVSVAFRMNLFNIGVEGQYRMAMVVAAGVGAAVALPGPLHVILIVVVAMVAGAPTPASPPSSR